MNSFRPIILASALLTAVLFAQVAIGQSPAPTPAERVLIGAYDARHINGLVFVANEGNIFGLRLLVYRPDATVEEAPRQFELGAHAADGSYARLDWRSRFDEKSQVVLRWSRVGRNILAGQLTAPAGVRVALEAYQPWRDARNEMSWPIFAAASDRRTIFGEQVHSQSIKPAWRRFLLRADRAGGGAAIYDTATALHAVLSKDGHAQSPLSQPELGRHAALSFELNQNSSIGFIAVLGDDFAAMEREAEQLLQKPIAELLDQAEKISAAARPRSTGELGESLEWVSRALLWNRLYDHRLHQEYVTMHRLSKHQLRGDALGWDALLLTALTGLLDAQSARATVRVVLAGQTPDGRVPLRRQMQIENPGEPPVLAGRTMPPIGALCAWKVYQATRDLELLAWAYPRLRRWNDWWRTKRDGNGQAWRDGDGDNLLEWGFDAEAEYGLLGARTLANAAQRQLAFSESGRGEHWLKLYGAEANAGIAASEPKFNDKTHTLEFSPVGLNALYALDTEMLMLIARELGLNNEAARWEFRYDELKKLINEKMWSAEDGAYLNRRWDGQLIRRVTAENFYVLAAGVPDDERARQLAAKLRAADLENVSSPTGNGAGTGGQAARSFAWAPLNYLLYLGLRRYKLHEDAAALARGSTALARAGWEKQGQFYDLFAAADGRPLDAEQEGLRTSFAGLMFWPGVEELIAADPWSGFTLGRLTADAEARVERVPYDGARWDVISSASRTLVRRNERVEIEVEGPAVLRGYRSNERTIIFTIEIKKQLRLLVPSSAGRKITVSVDDKVLGSMPVGLAASFRVPAGVHKVLIIK